MTPRIPTAKLPLVKAGARCDLCPLRERPAVPSELRPGAKVTIVGEAPGKTEEKLGAPFRGVSGQLLEKLLSTEAGLKRSEVSLTNAALCRGENEDDQKRATACCSPRLLGEIPRMVGPIVPLGGLATQAVLGLSKILLVRGFIFTAPHLDTEPFRKAVLKAPIKSLARGKAELAFAAVEARARLAGRTVLPTLHPRFVLQSETWHPVVRADFRRIGRVVRGEIRQLADVGRHVVATDTKALARLAHVVSLDVETTHAPSPYLAKLLCVGLSDGAQSVVLWPWGARMARPLGRWLATRKTVVGHNLMAFDRVVLEEAGVK